MDDLNSLCRICHTNPPQYTCPRCSIRTCSLACIQTHKRRAPCSGVRDPTVFKPMRQLATPAGIDHDYNFLSAIERSVERSDRLLVEEKGIVTAKELREGPPEPKQFRARGRGRGRGGRGGAGGDGVDHAGVKSENEIKILKEYQRIGVRVEKLPKGMARQKLNGTSWSRKQKCVVMQVEWLRALEAQDGKPGEVETIMSKVLTTTPIGIAYKNILEERRRAAMTPEEKAQEKKKRAAEVAEKVAKRPKPSEPVLAADGSSVSTAELETGSTSQQGTELVAEPATKEPSQPSQPEEVKTETHQPFSKPANTPNPKPVDPFVEVAKTFVSDFKFFIRRPHTPSNLPTVLIPLDYTKPLEVVLEGKVVVEFPTIYVFSNTIEKLPGGFMSQDDFFQRMKTGGKIGEEGEVDSSEEESSDDEPEAKSSKPIVPDSDTSSNGSSDESSEEESEDEEDEEQEKATEPGTKEDVEMNDTTAAESKTEVAEAAPGMAVEQPVGEATMNGASGIPGLDML